jgi:hypothetical protein
MKYASIAKVIMQKGVDNVVLPDTIKTPVLNETGQLLFKEGHYEESGKAFAKAGNKVALQEATTWLSQQGRFKQASYFIIHSGNNVSIEDCALSCMNQGHFSIAIVLFEKTENRSMIEFIKQNFQQNI